MTTAGPPHSTAERVAANLRAVELQLTSVASRVPDPAFAGLLTHVGAVLAVCQADLGGKAAAAARSALPKATTLASYLRSHLGDDVTVEDVALLEGGFSKRTIAVGITQSGEPRNLIVRQVVEGQPSESLRSEYEVVRHVAAGGLPAPTAFWVDDERNPLGEALFVTTREPGVTLGTVFGPTAEIPPPVWIDLARFLGSLHSLPQTPDAVPGLPMRSRAELLAAVDVIEASHRQLLGTDPPAGAAAAISWLRTHAPDVDTAVLLHGDFGLHNVLVHSDRLSAVLDWEKAHLGSPSEDIAYAYDTLGRFCDWDAFLAAYLEAGGSPPVEAELRWFAVWQELWRWWECVRLGEEVFERPSLVFAIAGCCMAPRFLANAVAATT